MQPLTSDWLGKNRPKQYCTFVGSRSMLQHTLDRACSVVRRQNVLTVTGRGHHRHLADAAKLPLPGRVIEQPLDAGTAPGVFLPAAYALLNDPEATLVLFPSDHFVHPEAAFCALANRAAELAELHRNRIVLIGAVPDSPESDYGWIGAEANGKAVDASEDALDAMNVAAFREKPGPAEAGLLWREGYLWNTMVLAVRAKTLWELGRKHLPEMVSSFDALLMVLRAIRQGLFDPKCEPEVLARLYEHLTPADFSRDVLQHAASDCLLLPMRGIHWSDWGRPERVTQTLARLGRTPLFFSETQDPDFCKRQIQEAGV
jgi:mannose-1-phosphate guanylyltransferase